jgi:hypothetical protein
MAAISLNRLSIGVSMGGAPASLQRHTVSESVLYVKRVEGGRDAMPDTGAGRLPATTRGSSVQDADRDTCRHSGGVENLDSMPASRAGRKERSKQADKQNKVPLATIVAIEQWVCFALGITCMAFGIWGICMKCSVDTLRADIAWLGPVYVPTLRVTAVVCLVMGVLLVRRAWP